MVVVPFIPADGIVGLLICHPAALFLRVQLHCFPGVFTGRLMVAGSPVIVQTGQADAGSDIFRLALQHTLQEPDAVIEGFPGNPALMPEHVLNTLEFRFVGKLEQFVDGDAEEDCDVWQ